MPKVPDSTNSSLQQKLSARARGRWPQLTDVDVIHRGSFAYVTGTLRDGEQLPLCRLRYGGSARIWGVSIYRASHDDYQPSTLHTGMTAGSPKTPSTPPAASTSTTPALGPDPRRTHEEKH